MAWRSRYKLVKQTAPLWLLWGAGLAALMLVIAHGFERFGHLAPCELCLRQRDGYWTAVAVGLIGYTLARWKVGWSRALLLLLAAVFAVEGVLAAYHAGVEWKWWPGPASCTGVSRAGASDLMAGIASLTSGARVHVVRCDEAAWRLFGLSMAGWNTLLAGALAAATLVAFARVRRPR